MAELRMAEAQRETSAQMFDPLRFSKPPGVTGAERKRMIAEAAYYRALQRGFVPGFENEDWLAAEAEVIAQLYRRDFGQGPAAGK